MQVLLLDCWYYLYYIFYKIKRNVPYINIKFSSEYYGDLVDLIERK